MSPFPSARHVILRLSIAFNLVSLATLGKWPGDDIRRVSARYEMKINAMCQDSSRFCRQNHDAMGGGTYVGDANSSILAQHPPFSVAMS